MISMRRSRRGEPVAWVVVAGAAAGAGAAIVYLLSPERRARAADGARRAGRRAVQAARRTRERAGAGLQHGTERARARARSLATSAHRAGEEARGKAQAIARDLGARVRETRGQLGELRPDPEVEGDRAGAAATLLLGRAILGKGLLRVPFGVAGLSLAGRTAPVRRCASAAARLARRAARALRAERGRLERAARVAEAAGDADHPSLAGVGEVRDRVEAGERGLTLTESPRSDSPEEEGGPGLQAEGAAQGDGGWRAPVRSPEEESAPLIVGPDAMLPEADAAPRVEAPDERPIGRSEKEERGAGSHYEMK